MLPEFSISPRKKALAELNQWMADRDLKHERGPVQFITNEWEGYVTAILLFKEIKFVGMKDYLRHRDDLVQDMRANKFIQADYVMRLRYDDQDGQFPYRQPGDVLDSWSPDSKWWDVSNTRFTDEYNPETIRALERYLKTIPSREAILRLAMTNAA